MDEQHHPQPPSSSAPLPQDKDALRHQPAPPPAAQKRQSPINKFPTLHNEKYPSQLGRDLLLTSNFDRNLTVEKARFEPPQLIPPAASSPAPAASAPSPPSASSVPEEAPLMQASLSHGGAPDESLLSSSAEGRYPALSSSTSTSGAHYPSMTDRGSESERNQPRRPGNKKRRRPPPPPMHGTASPSEVFHRNLIDAVYSVEDSDENERYVYPYDHQRGMGAPERPFLYRIHTMPMHHNKNPWLSNWLPPERRPKLRSHVIDHPHRPKHIDPAILRHHHVPRRSNRPNIYGDGGYTSDDEEALPLLRSGRRLRSKSRNRSCSRLCVNLFLGIVAAVAFFLLVTMYRATPLTDMSVELGRVLASDKELIFDLRVHANNWNWWTVRIAQADIGVFAFSSLVPLDTSWADSTTATANMNDTISIAADPAEYLGSFYHFDEPLSFQPTFMTGIPSTAISQIRIKSPGADKSGAERWSRLIRYPYGLVTRGILKYTTIPYIALYPQSTAICNVAHVDPTTGTVSDAKPDEAYCPRNGDS